MTEHLAGHVKRNPETGEVAVRTVFPVDNPRLARLEWVIASVNIGARNARFDEVEGWDDLFVPPAPEPDPEPDFPPAPEPDPAPEPEPEASE